MGILTQLKDELMDFLAIKRQASWNLKCACTHIKIDVRVDNFGYDLKSHNRIGVHRHKANTLCPYCCTTRKRYMSK